MRVRAHTRRRIGLLVALLLTACIESGQSGTTDLGESDVVTDLLADTMAGDLVSPDGDSALLDTTTPPDGVALDSTRDSETTPCPSPVALTASSQLGTLVAEAGWNWVGPYSSGTLSVSADLVVSGTLQLSADDVAVPPECLARDDCRHAAFFRVPQSIDGVTPDGGDSEMPWLGSSPRLTLKDTTVRIRPMLMDTHPSRYNFVPLLVVLPPCEGPCPASQDKCPVDNVCYGEGEFCRLCLALPKETCACWTARGTEPDGSECSFMVSGDVMCTGTCRDGVCHSDQPGWAGCP